MSSLQQMTFDDFLPFDISLSDSQTYFLVSQRVGDAYETKKISLSNLARSLSSSIFSIRSAAYAQSSDFALSSHDHDIYTSAYYANALSSTNVFPILSVYDITHSTSSVVEVCNSGASTSTSRTIAGDLPRLGVIQMVATPSMTCYNDVFSPSSSNFIGWVIADGSEYFLSDFVMSASISNVLQAANDKFTVPNLNAFCRISTGLDSNSYNIVEGKSYTPSHVHSVQQSDDGSQIQIYSSNISTDNTQLCTLMTIYVNNPGTNVTTVNMTKVQDGVAATATMPPGLSASGRNCTLGSFQAGITSGTLSTTYPIYSETYTCPANCSTTSLKNLNIVLSAGEDGSESYPSHQMMPTTIYVGPSRFSTLVVSND